MEASEKQNYIDFMRYLMVEVLLSRGSPYLEVWEAASEELEGTDFGGAADTIRWSHRNYRKRHGVGPNKDLSPNSYDALALLIKMGISKANRGT